MNSYKTYRQFAFFSTLFGLIALGGCSQENRAPVPQTPDVAVVTVHRESVPVTMELPGRTSPYLIAQVRARVDGIVLKRTFQEGADVKAHQSLYQIDQAPYRAALNNAEATQQKAEANLASTTTQLERYKILVNGNAISKQAYDNALAGQLQAAADVAAAKAAVMSAKINLGYTNVVSPIAGRSAISQVTQGAYVQGSAATLLTTVQQIDPIYVDLQQSSAEGLQLRRDVASGKLKVDGPDQAKVTLTLEDGSTYPLAGTLQFSGITVDPGTGSVTMRALFPNPKNVLLPGMFVRASVKQGVNDNALLVPIAGVSHNPQGQPTVLVMGKDSKVASRTIQTKSMVNGNWVVEAGLNDGEQVIVSGLQKVQPGMLVKATAAQTAAPSTAKSDVPTMPGAQQVNVPEKTVVATRAN